MARSLKDPVPNVRFVAIKTLKQIVGRYPSMSDQIKKTIMGAAEDPDKDVKFYAQEAVNTL